MNSLWIWNMLPWIFLVCSILLGMYIYMTMTNDMQLKCIVSTVDGEKYCVRERSKVQEAVDLLAHVTQKCKDLVVYMQQKYPTKENVQRLVQNFHPESVMETLPTSTYTAYSENKGQKLAFCLTTDKHGNVNQFIDEHTLTFVAIHELAHTMTKSIGHKNEFWDNFRFLLLNAKEAGIHEPRDYKTSPVEYCSMKLTDNPFYDR